MRDFLKGDGVAEGCSDAFEGGVLWIASADTEEGDGSRLYTGSAGEFSVGKAASVGFVEEFANDGDRGSAAVIVILGDEDCLGDGDG